MKFISMKQKQKRNHNFIEIENEFTYGESIVNKSRVENLISFPHYITYLVLVICVSRKT